MAESSTNSTGVYGPRRLVSGFRPHHHNVLGPHVLIVAAHKGTRRELELSLPDGIRRKSVSTALEAEGHGTEVVVVAGDFPLAELIEVRAHPQLHDKPVVLFAPGKDLPAMDWRSSNVWPVITQQDALGQLIEHVHHLFSDASHDAGRHWVAPV